MPAMIFISVDLPAPFSPISAWTRAALQPELDVVERDDARKFLADALDLEKELGIRDGAAFADGLHGRGTDRLGHGAVSSHAQRKARDSAPGAAAHPTCAR